MQPGRRRTGEHTEVALGGKGNKIMGSAFRPKSMVVNEVQVFKFLDRTSKRE